MDCPIFIDTVYWESIYPYFHINIINYKSILILQIQKSVCLDVDVETTSSSKTTTYSIEVSYKATKRYKIMTVGRQQQHSKGV